MINFCWNTITVFSVYLGVVGCLYLAIDLSGKYKHSEERFLNIFNTDFRNETFGRKFSQGGVIGVSVIIFCLIFGLFGASNCSE